MRGSSKKDPLTPEEEYRQTVLRFEAAKLEYGEGPDFPSCESIEAWFKPTERTDPLRASRDYWEFFMVHMELNNLYWEHGIEPRDHDRIMAGCTRELRTPEDRRKAFQVVQGGKE